MEEPYIPFYKPYGMTDEEYSYEVAQAKQRHAEWDAEQEQIKISLNLPVIGSVCSHESQTWNADAGCMVCDYCNGRC